MNKKHLSWVEDPQEANRFVIHRDGNWLMSVLHNGEAMPERQRENMHRLVACWNACEGSSTEWLKFQCNEDAIEQFGQPEPFETRYTKELRRAVDLLDTLQSIADCDMSQWAAEFKNGDDFKLWAQSRARAVIGKGDQTITARADLESKGE